MGFAIKMAISYVLIQFICVYRPLMLPDLPQDMRVQNNDRVISALASPGSTRSASGARGPGQLLEQDIIELGQGRR